MRNGVVKPLHTITTSQTRFVRQRNTDELADLFQMSPGFRTTDQEIVMLGFRDLIRVLESQAAVPAAEMPSRWSDHRQLLGSGNLVAGAERLARIVFEELHRGGYRLYMT